MPRRSTTTKTKRARTLGIRRTKRKSTTSSRTSNTSKLKVRKVTSTKLTKGNIDGTQLIPYSKFSPDFMKTASHVLQHYLYVWWPNSSTHIKTLKRKGFTVWGNAPQRGSKIINDKMITTKKSPAKALVAENENGIIVTFRGSGVQKNDKTMSARTKALSKTLKNMIADLNVALEKNKNFPGHVHKGFCEEYTHIRSSVLSAIKKCDYKNKPIFVSGFSLGAGMATLCLWDIKKTLKVTPHGYLFACPAAGDATFEKNLTKSNKNIYRFMHERDIVGQIPHCFFNEYEAAGNNLFVFKTNRLKNKNNSPATVTQLNHNKMKLNIKLKKSLGSNFLAKITGKKYLKGKGVITTNILPTLANDVILPFVRFHNGEFYRDCFIEFHNSFNKKRAKGTSLVQSAKKQKQLCKKHSVSLKQLFKTKK